MKCGADIRGKEGEAETFRYFARCRKIDIFGHRIEMSTVLWLHLSSYEINSAVRQKGLMY